MRDACSKRTSATGHLHEPVVCSELAAKPCIRLRCGTECVEPAERRTDEAQAWPAREEEDEETVERERTPPLMVVVPALLLLGAIVIGLIPGAVPGIETAASHFRDHMAYFGWVLHGAVVKFPHATTSHIQGYDYLYGAGAAVGAVLAAATALFAYPLLARLPRVLVRPVVAGLGVFRDLHSGHIGDYIAWWTAGAALLGGSSLLALT